MRRLRIFGFFAIVSLLLHFAWESWHVRFYSGYENLSPYLPLALWASIADVFYVLGAVLFVSLFKEGIGWLAKPKRADLFGLATTGFFIAIFVEYKAMIFEKWHYLETMPIIPWLEVGLSPILQMTILLPLGVYCAGLLYTYLEKNLSAFHERKNL